MDRVIYTAMTGASQSLTRQAGMANNMANATTTGFRAEMHAFMAVPVDGPGLPTRTLVVDGNPMTDFKPGPLQATGRELDVAIQGPGFIALSLPDGGEAYTRNGSLSLSANGGLQSASGVPILGEDGPIAIPPDADIAIAADGTVSARARSGTGAASVVVGRIRLVNPPAHALVRGDDGLFRLGAGMRAMVGGAPGTLASGFLEGSNVDLASEMIDMIAAARQFEMHMKVITSAEDNDKAAAKLLTLS
jgi:flagellar basal-body rod protein FlgF